MGGFILNFNKGNLKMVILACIAALSVTACSGNANEATTEVNESKEPSVTQSKALSDYLQKPITFTAASGAGGGLDQAARILAKVLSTEKIVTQTLTVENKPGGGQAVAMAEFITKDKTNSHKFLVVSPPIVINNLKKDGYSPHSFKDMTPIAHLFNDYAIIAVKADSKYKDLISLFEAIKADPSKVTIAGGSSPGSQDHLNPMMIAVKAGIDPKKVKYLSYDGGGEAMTALLGGNADVLSTDLVGMGEFIEAGKIRILGISGPARLPGKFKDIPTYKEQGIDVEYVNWRGVFGVKDIPQEVVAYWEEKIKTMSDTDSWKQNLEMNGSQGTYQNSAEFKVFLEQQEEMFKEVLGALDMLK
jgi:putative tricarboxylic transport membrane protein